MVKATWSMLACVCVLAAACAPSRVSVGTEPTVPAAANPDENRTIVFATRNEPVYISKRGLQSTAPLSRQ